jgi:hypothetical protein
MKGSVKSLLTLIIIVVQSCQMPLEIAETFEGGEAGVVVASEE